MCLPVIQCRITLQRSLLNIRLYCPLLCTSLPHCTILCPPYIYDRKVFIITLHLTLSINVKTVCYGATDIVCILHLYFGFPTLLFHDCVNSHLVVYHGKMANAHVSPLMWLHGHVPAMCKDVDWSLNALWGNGPSGPRRCWNSRDGERPAVSTGLLLNEKRKVSY